MYGLVNKAIEELVSDNFGADRWEAIKVRAGVEVEVFISNDGYPDELTYRLIGAAAAELELSVEQVLLAFGEHWVLQTGLRNYGPMLKAGGRTLREFLLNLPNFHTRVAMIYPELEPPGFECSDVTESGLQLHYITRRPGLTAFVSGLLQGLGKLYETPCTTTVIARKDQGAHHDIFAVRWNTTLTE